jgi:hypothetical protein
MSIAVDWRQPRTPAQPHRRKHLALVPPLVEVPEPPRPRSGLTQRGRLVRTLLVFTLLMIGLLHLVDGAPPPADLSVDHVATVRSGQTLTQIAAQELPALSVEEGVRRIRIVNALQATGLYPGQTLQIPVNR